MHMCTRTSLCACFASVCVCLCVRACVRACVHVRIPVYIRAHLCICGCVDVSMCACVSFYLCVHVYGIRQKECNKLTVAVLISTTYHAPCLSLCVVHTFTLSLKARQLVKRLRRVLPNRGVLAKITARLAKSTAICFPHKSRGKQQKYGTFLIKMRRNQF